MSTRILALDTSTEACSVALWNDGEINVLFEVCPRDHTQRILPMVQQLLANSELSLSQLDALAFGRGPGSFTGVRIGVGIAQGLAFGAELPMLSLSTLKTMAQGVWRVSGGTQVLVAIDARMGELYWGEFVREGEIWHETSEEAVLAPEVITPRLMQLSGNWMTAGTGWPAYPELASHSAVPLCSSSILLPTAEDMLPLALIEWQQGRCVNAEQAEPVYLRNTVAWKKLPGR